jgi:hypothetical protein
MTVLVVESRIAGQTNLLASRRKEYFTLAPRRRRDRRQENSISLCIDDNYTRIITPVDLNSFQCQNERKKIPSGWKQNGGIASTEIPPLKKPNLSKTRT